MEWTRGCILGWGSSATVSIAAAATSGEIFAVKSVGLSQSDSLQRERQFLSILNSPHVIGYKGFEITKENNKLIYNLMMQYMPNGTLVDMSSGRFHEREISNYIRQIVRGLEYIHSCGIVHCDIKGRNILVDENGAKIADFGCAKWADQAAPFGGTPMFMAPEVARGEEQGFPADIWALGCTVIEMATGGSSPWPNANDPVSVLYRIAFSMESPEIPDSFSDQAKDFVTKCLQRDLKDRWTAKQLLKHPFLQESKNHTTKLITCNDFSADSPTSILDQDVWNSMEESLPEGGDAVESMKPSSSPMQRIKQLADISVGSSWKREVGMGWITIRSHEDGKAVSAVGGGEREEDGTVCGCLDLGLIINFMDDKVSCRGNRCRCNCSCGRSNYC